MRALAALGKELNNAKTYEALKDVERRAKWIALAYADIDEIKHQAQWVMIDARCKLDDQVQKVTKVGGPGRGKDFSGEKNLLGRMELPIPSKERHINKRLNQLSEKERRAIADELWATGADVTAAAILKAVSEMQRSSQRQAYSKQTYDGGTIASLAEIAETQKFGAIYADPPWTFEVYSGKGKQRSAERHYDTMSLDKLAAMPVADLAAKDCALFLWSVWPELPGALRVIEAWGFKYTTAAFVYVKQNRSGKGLFTGMGYWTRANTEPCLLATKGSPTRLAMDVPQVIMEPVGKHSAKPVEARKRIVRLVPGPYLELFAREQTKGWTTWGNQIPALQ